MRSMTGFGQAEHPFAGTQIRVQIAAVNHRHCQIHLRGDLRDVAIEHQLRSLLRKRLRRGSITAHVYLQRDAALPWSREQLKQAWDELNSIAAELGAPIGSLCELGRLLGHDSSAPSHDHEAFTGACEQTCIAAIAELEAMRSREGAHLRGELLADLARIRELRERMQRCAAPRSESYRARLQARLDELLSDQVDPEILTRELALYAERIDVSEELARIDSHCQQVVDLLDQDGDTGHGRQLEFLLQELGREINTTGAKANDAELSALVVEAKTTLEQMREQAANIL